MSLHNGTTSMDILSMDIPSLLIIGEHSPLDMPLGNHIKIMGVAIKSSTRTPANWVYHRVGTKLLNDHAKQKRLFQHRRNFWTCIYVKCSISPHHLKRAWSTTSYPLLWTNIVTSNVKICTNMVTISSPKFDNTIVCMGHLTFI